MAGNSILTSVIEKKMGQALNHLSPKIHADYASIHANLFKSSAFINDLHIDFIPYSNTPQYRHSLHFNNLTLTGINLFKVIFNSTLSIKNVSFNKAEIKLDPFLLDKKDSAQAITDSLHLPFKNLAIANLGLRDLNVWLHAPPADRLLLRGNIALQGAEINLTNNSGASSIVRFKSVEGLLSDIDYAMRHHHYTIRVKKLMLNSNKQQLLLDSLKIISQKDIDSSQNNMSRMNIDVTATTIKITKLNILQLLPGFSDGKSLDEKDRAAILVSDLRVHLMQNNKGHLSHHSIYCKRLSCKGIDFANAILNHSLFVNTINLEGCDIRLDPVLLDKIRRSKGKMLSKFSFPFKNLSINMFKIREGNIWLHSGKKERLLLKGDLTVNKVVLNHKGSHGTIESHLAAIGCNLSDIDYPLPDGLYMMHINKLKADSKAAMLRINSLKIVPRYNKYQFGKRLGHQQDWIKTNIGDIEISKLNYANVLHKELRADKITFNNCKIYVFRDRRLPRLLKQQPMPNDYLKKIPFNLRVNHLQMNNASVIYEEFPKDGTQSGTLQLANMNMSMSPVLNHPFKTDPVYSDTYITGSIMNSGSIKATIHGQLEKNIYYIKGSIENLDLSRLNSSAENLGKFHIKSGILNSLNFHFTATDKKSSGEIIGEYHNLIIERLKVRNGLKKVAKVPTFFLKHLIIPKNKDKSMDAARRTGKIDYNRDPTRMVTFYLLKSLLSGIRASFDLGFLLPK